MEQLIFIHMDYTISRERLIRLIGKMIQGVYPDFVRGKCHIDKINTTITPIIHYFKDGKTFAKYHLNSNTLWIEKELFHTLENFFGLDAMSFILDWFNNEFGQDAESLNYI